MVDKKILMDILNSREERATKQRELIKRHDNSLISFTLNIPGALKDSPLYRDLHNEGMNTILDTLKDKNIFVLYKEQVHKRTGSEGFIVADVNADDLKRLTVDIEEHHALGRIFDIDVFDSNHNQISRTDLNLNPRKCLICNKEVRICMREKNHSYEELIHRIEDMGNKLFQ